MKVKTEEKEGVTTLTIDGNIAQESVAIFKNRLSDLIESKKLHIVLNLSEASYISSMCLAVIVDAKNRLGQIHGDIKIAVPKGIIRNLFEITNLVKKFEVYDTVEVAVASFAKKPGR
jgi:anti-anti-sigma factor